MITNDYKYTIGKNVFEFLKDSHPNSKRNVMMNGFYLGAVPSDNLNEVNQIARLISRAIHFHNARAGGPTEKEDAEMSGCPERDLIRRLLANLRSRRGQLRFRAVMHCFDIDEVSAINVCKFFDYDPDEVLPPFDDKGKDAGND